MYVVTWCMILSIKRAVTRDSVKTRIVQYTVGEPRSYQLKVQNTVLADFRPRREAQKRTGLTGCADI